MNSYTQLVISCFKKQGNSTIKKGQEAYLRNQFTFIGIKTPLRRALQKHLLTKNALPSKNEVNTIVLELYQLPEREYHYFAMELLYKYKKEYVKEDILLFEHIITNHSWWDTVDFIAAKILGAYFKSFPENRVEQTTKWLKQKNEMWLHRSALLFQLKYKDETDTKLLSYFIENLSSSKEFFIQKAIGWVLREYSKTNPEWVSNYVAKTTLAPLSKKEALRLIK